MTPPPKSHDDHPATPSPLGHVEEWESSAIDYLEGRLSPLESSAIIDHLAACRSCRERLAEQRRMVLMLDAVQPAELPPDLESRVFDRDFPLSALPSTKQSTEPGVLRRLLTGLARRPWVPAAIAAIVVMVALAGSGDVIRSGGGAETAQSDLSAPTAVGEASRDAAGNVAAPLGVPGAETTIPGAMQDLRPQIDSGSPRSTEATVAASMAAVSAGGPKAAATHTSAPTVWVSVEVAAGDVNAGATVQGVTGLHPLTTQATPGVPIYAAMIWRGSIEVVLQQLSSAGLAVMVSDVPQAPLDPAAIQGVQEISALPYLEPVSPQGDTLSASIISQAVNAESEYVLMVLSAVR